MNDPTAVMLRDLPLKYRTAAIERLAQQIVERYRDGLSLSDAVEGVKAGNDQAADYWFTITMRASALIAAGNGAT